jgi:hypothetical protein
MSNDQPDLSGMERVAAAPANSPSMSPPPLADTPGWNPFQRSPLPPSLNTPPDQQRQFYNRNMGPQRRVLPQQAAGIASSNAAARAQAINVTESGLGLQLQTNGQNNATQSLLNLLAGANITLTANALGGVTITGTAGGDGLTHGTTPWESDPSYICMRDDFFSCGQASGSVTTQTNAKIGDLGWEFYSNSGNSFSSVLGAPPNVGNIAWENTATASQTAILALATGSALGNTTYAPDAGMALLENPPWQLTWIWKTDLTNSSSQHVTTKKAIYIGLFGPSFPTSVTATASRPTSFIGIRFDTSTTPAIPAGTVTAVGNASAGNTVYTITSYAPAASNAFVNTTFTASGLAGGTNNNGTFVCTASTATTITLANPNGTAESTQAGTLTGPTPPSDSFYTFEQVQNLIPDGQSGHRNNLHGQTFTTNVAPVAGVYHRLDMTCTTAGKVTLTLDGSSVNTVTFTVPKDSITVTGAVTGDNNGTGGYLLEWSNITTVVGHQSDWSTGSIITVSGFPAGAPAQFNGTFTIQRAQGPTTFNIETSGSSELSTGNTVTMVGYPAYTPMFWAGNDDTASPADNISFFVDFFSFVWNPGLFGGGRTPTITKPRYW